MCFFGDARFVEARVCFFPRNAGEGKKISEISPELFRCIRDATKGGKLKRRTPPPPPIQV